MKILLKLTVISLVIFTETSFAANVIPMQQSSGKSCYPNAGAVIAYVQGASKSNNFTNPSGQYTSLDTCVLTALTKEGWKVNGNPMVNGAQPALTMQQILGNAANWPTQNKLNVASTINSSCGSPYTQFDYTSSTFKTFLNTYAKVASNLSVNWCSN